MKKQVVVIAVMLMGLIFAGCVTTFERSRIDPADPTKIEKTTITHLGTQACTAKINQDGSIDITIAEDATLTTVLNAAMTSGVIK